MMDENSNSGIRDRIDENTVSSKPETLPKAPSLPPGFPPLPLNSNGKLDPQLLFELVSKHYDTWQNAVGRQFEEEDNFLPFPSEDLPNITRDDAQQPIFNYSLLEALEKSSTELARELEQRANRIQSSQPEVKIQIQQSADMKNLKETNEAGNDVSISANSASGLLQESEINYLQNKIVQIFRSNNVHIPKREGFSLYDTQDEEGLHEPNGSDVEDEIKQAEEYSQDDYDIEEIQDSMYHEYHPTHHIEVELNTEDGRGGSSGRTIFNNNYDFEDDGGPSCEFTFEYDHNGKLVPTHNNVEEKLRLMLLQNRMRGIEEPKLSKNQKKKKKKKEKQQQQQHYQLQQNQQIQQNQNQQHQQVLPPSSQHQQNQQQHQQADSKDGCCLLCEYETIYGARPKQMIKWYDQKIRIEELKRAEIRKKLENAKLKALKKQRELRQRQQLLLQQQEECLAESEIGELPLAVTQGETISNE